MMSSKLLGGIRKIKRGGKSKKGGMSDDNIKTVKISLPEYMGGQNNDEPPFNNDESNNEKVDVNDQQLDETENDEYEPDNDDGEPDNDDGEPEVDDGEPEVDDGEPEVDDAEPEVDETKTKVVEKKTKKQVLVPQLFGFRDQLKLYHWQTQSHSRHVASGDFVTSLSGFIDTFVEIYQGKYGRIQLDNIVSIKLKNLNDTTVIEYLNKYKNYLLYTLPGTLNEVTDTDLLNLKDEMLAEANKLLYLFTLK